MYALFTDETNLEPSKEVKFFIYGGIFFPIARLSILDDKIREIRIKAGYKNSDEFKFDSRSKPRNVSKQTFDRAKNKVLDLGFENGIQFIAYLILHKIASKRRLKVNYAINHVIGRFNQFLEENKDYGICILDRLPNPKYQFRFISEKFSKGLTLDAGRNVLLDRIKSFSFSCIGASNVGSMVDIILGSFRYCINNPRNKRVANYLMKKVISLMWHVRVADKIYFLERGLIIRPKTVRKQEYQQEYTNLIKQINALLGNSGV